MKDLFKFFCEFLHENTSIYPCINTNTSKYARVYVLFWITGSSGDLIQGNNLVCFFSNHMKDLTSTRFLFTQAPREGENIPTNLNRKLNGTCFNNSQMCTGPQHTCFSQDKIDMLEFAWNGNYYNACVQGKLPGVSKVTQKQQGKYEVIFVFT